MSDGIIVRHQAEHPPNIDLRQGGVGCGGPDQRQVGLGDDLLRHMSALTAYGAGNGPHVVFVDEPDDLVSASPWGIVGASDQFERYTVQTTLSICLSDCQFGAPS